MNCKDCIHSGLCYKENDYENFPDRCGSFIPEKPQGKWIIDKNGDYICNQCRNYPLRNDNEKLTLSNFCPNCGADMHKSNCVTCNHFGKCEGCEKREEE